MAAFDVATERYLQDVVAEINATPTGGLRNKLTELQIKLMEIQDHRKGDEGYWRRMYSTGA